MVNAAQQPFCPLYNEAREAAPWRSASAAHAGLLFDKFANAWRPDDKTAFAFDKGDKTVRESKQSEKQKAGYWLRNFAAKKPGNADQLAETCQRQRQLAGAQGGKTLYLKNTSRFVTGMGREHPLENGFVWHHTLGVPYLPASSVKGLLRAWYRENGTWNEEKEKWGVWNPNTKRTQDEENINYLFGSNDNDKEGNMFGVGRFIVLDMIPITPPELVVEVMTPHYAPYYQDDRRRTIPGDWHSPVPINFLAVEAGQSWQLSLLPGPAGRTVSPSDLESLQNELLEALGWLGAGAKTAVGYGRFAIDREAQQRVERDAAEQRKAQAKAEKKTAEQAEFESSISNDSEPLQQLKRLQHEQNWQLSAGDHNMMLAMQRFAGEHADPPQDCLDWIRNLLESIQNYKGVWDNPEAKRGKKQDKFKYPSKAIREIVTKLTSRH